MSGRIYRPTPDCAVNLHDVVAIQAYEHVPGLYSIVIVLRGGKNLRSQYRTEERRDEALQRMIHEWTELYTTKVAVKTPTEDDDAPIWPFQP